MIAGARDVGVSPAIVGAFQRKEAALVEVTTPSNGQFRRKQIIFWMLL
jgi:hypothetical protein